MLVKDQCFESL